MTTLETAPQKITPESSGAAHVDRYKNFRYTRHFGSLDGLRAISIVIVIWHHICGDLYARQLGLNILGMGYMGVHLFFVISGFLITTLLLREQEQHGNISLRLFYARRTLRIFPLYYTVLAIFTLLVFVVERHSYAAQAFYHNLPCFITYTANIFMTGAKDNPHRVIFAFAWSLAAEEQFYLFWPATLKILRRHWSWIVLIAILLVDQFAVIQGADGLVQGRTQRVMMAVPSAIICGTMLALIMHSRRGYAIIQRLCGWKWGSMAAVAIVLGMLSLPFTSDTRFTEIAALPLVLLVASCVVREDHALSRILGLRLMVSVGVVSYGMYLMHMFAVHAAYGVLGRINLKVPAIEFVVAVAGAYLLAMISYYTFERRFLKLKERFSRSQPSRPH